jgi:uncharacterized heparinase superfamily protein
MPLPEIGYRAYQSIIIWRERRRFNRGNHNSRENATRPPALQGLFENDTPFYFNRAARDALAHFYIDHFPEEYATTVAVADDLLEHVFSFFGRCFVLEGAIQWQQDPLTKNEWPANFWADVDIRDGQKVGGVKWVWELNRHHHLVTLGKAYFVTSDQRYAREAVEQMMSWISHNPPGLGVNWTSSLELAIRLINWNWTLAFLKDAPELTRDALEQITRSIISQADHISSHLSAYSSANNHLIGEAAGLVIAGLAFPGLPRADRYRQKGLVILYREIERQIYSDGVPAEQAIHYLVFVLDFYLLVWRLCEQNGISIPKGWCDRLSAAVNFIHTIMDEDGHLPEIGDSDDAWVVRLDERPDFNPFLSFLTSGAILLKQPGGGFKSAGWDEKNFWLMGLPEMEAFYSAQPGAVKVPSSQLFREGGYAVMRAPGSRLIFDCGPIGYLSTAAHGHADALSLVGVIDRSLVLAEAGTYAYQEGGEWRKYFRGTSAHNSLVVDGLNQSEILGPFLWGRKAKARLMVWKPGNEFDLAVAELDGYLDLGIVHRRAVIFYKPDCIAIKDRLSGKGMHAFEQLWHFLPGVQVRVEENYVRVHSDGHDYAFLRLDGSDAKMEVIEAQDMPIQGWFSARYGEKEPAPVLRCSARENLPAGLFTAFIPMDVFRGDGWLERKAKLLSLLKDY